MKITRDSRKVDKRQKQIRVVIFFHVVAKLNLFLIILDMVLLTREFHVEHTHITIGKESAKITINATLVAQNGKASGIRIFNYEYAERSVKTNVIMDSCARLH